MANLYDTYVARQQKSANDIGNLYENKYKAGAAELANPYEQTMSNLRADQGKIDPAYQTKANQMNIAYERQRRNANVNALGSGLNSGTALQQQEAFNNQFQRNYAALRAEQAGAKSDLAQKMVDTTTKYNNDLAALRMNVENDNAAAQIENNNKLEDWYQQMAKVPAGYGDFSAYDRILGTNSTKQMSDVWIIQNPEAALGAGLIDKKRYKEITGHDAGTK